jgi:hypothetical protein
MVQFQRDSKRLKNLDVEKFPKMVFKLTKPKAGTQNPLFAPRLRDIQAPTCLASGNIFSKAEATIPIPYSPAAFVLSLPSASNK